MVLAGDLVIWANGISYQAKHNKSEHRNPRGHSLSPGGSCRRLQHRSGLLILQDRWLKVDNVFKINDIRIVNPLSQVSLTQQYLHIFERLLPGSEFGLLLPVQVHEVCTDLKHNSLARDTMGLYENQRPCGSMARV
jgi:hypothetical protein